jgi:multidrug efflux pump
MTQLGVPSSVRGVCRHRAGVPADHELAGDPDSGRHRHGLYRAGVLYESYVHPLTISRRCPPRGGRAAGAGAVWRAVQPDRADRDHAIDGIVKKNAIMMVDFALDAQRNGNLTPEEAIFQACLLRVSVRS